MSDLKLGLDGSSAPGGGRVLAGDFGTVLDLLPGVDDAGSASLASGHDQADEVHLAVREVRKGGVRFLGTDDVPFDWMTTACRSATTDWRSRGCVIPTGRS